MTISANCPGQLPTTVQDGHCPGQWRTPSEWAAMKAGQTLSHLSGTVRGQPGKGPSEELSAAPAPYGADRSGTGHGQDVTCRLAAGGEIPRTARHLIAKALSGGWTVAPTYARRNGVETLALRMWRRRDRAVAVWTDAGFSSAYTWSETRPIRKWGYRDLSRVVTSDTL